MMTCPGCHLAADDHAEGCPIAAAMLDTPPRELRVPEPARFRPAIVVTFPADNPADPQVSYEGITPGQLYAAAFLLDAIAREVRLEQRMRALMAPGGLTLPGLPGVPR